MVCSNSYNQHKRLSNPSGGASWTYSDWISNSFGLLREEVRQAREGFKRREGQKTFGRTRVFSFNSTAVPTVYGLCEESL